MSAIFKLISIMERRSFERIAVNIEAKFICGNRHYFGTVKNLSERGMFISTKKLCLPFDIKFEIFMAWKDKTFHLPVNLVRMITSPDSSDGLGIELQGPPREYSGFVKSLRFICRS